jgi:hypothetical protein
MIDNVRTRTGSKHEASASVTDVDRLTIKRPRWSRGKGHTVEEIAFRPARIRVSWSAEWGQPWEFGGAAVFGPRILKSGLVSDSFRRHLSKHWDELGKLAEAPEWVREFVQTNRPPEVA